MPIKDLLVVGDTNTVVSGAIFAKRNGVHLFHVEAGARCYDPTMPEEQNRRVADHLSDVLFAPTQWNKDTLRAEGIHAGVHVTGNSIIDGCVRVLARLPHQPPILNKIPYEEFALVTAHRPEIVDNPVRLSELIKICDGLPFPAVFPCHPRTRNRIRSFGLMKRLQDPDRILLLPPLGYTDFLALMKRSQFVVTDSGGVTEEATAPGFDKLVFSPREFTELPEAVQSGHLTVVGPHHLNALKAIQRRLDLHHRPHGHPYGRGRSGERIAKLIREHLSA
jgi:UDP-N-acetylglucosamine 2-epimerase (non-hydrolysing)